MGAPAQARPAIVLSVKRLDFMLQVPVLNEHQYSLDNERVFGVVEAVLKEKEVDADWLVSLAVVDDVEMTELNRQYHNGRGTTDVLSFPYTDEQSRQDVGELAFPEKMDDLKVLGDIVISYPEAEREAERKGVSIDEEIDFLVQHGMLHLLGFHHD